MAPGHRLPQYRCMDSDRAFRLSWQQTLCSPFMGDPYCSLFCTVGVTRTGWNKSDPEKKNLRCGVSRTVSLRKMVSFGRYVFSGSVGPGKIKVYAMALYLDRLADSCDSFRLRQSSSSCSHKPLFNPLQRLHTSDHKCGPYDPKDPGTERACHVQT